MIKLERSAEGWVVLGSSVLSTSPNLEEAALTALLLADLHGTTLEIDEEVRQEAQHVLERARKRRARFDAARQAAELAQELDRFRRRMARC